MSNKCGRRRQGKQPAIKIPPSKQCNFPPVARVAKQHVTDLPYLGAMNVATDDAVKLSPATLFSDLLLISC
jgi:hypothetical protein